MSLRRLGEGAHISPAMLSQIERNQTYPSVATLYKIAEVLNLPIEYFFQKPEEFKADEHPTRGAISPQEDGHHLVEWDITDLDETTPFIVRRNARPRIELKSGISLSTLTTSSEANIQFLELSYQPEARPKRGQVSHEGKEFGLIVEGELTIGLNDTAFTLREGDSIIINATEPHSIYNSCGRVTRAVWISIGDHFCLFEHFGQ